MDNAGKILIQKNILNNFDNFKEILNPFLPNISVGCESTYTYYWISDGCKEYNIPFYLGHALYMKAISWDKIKNDLLNAKTIADLMRINLLPEAYPYPPEMRPTRDLLRRRHRLVSLRAEAITHILLTSHQYAIEDIDTSLIKNREQWTDIINIFKKQNTESTIQTDLDVINALTPVIKTVEKEVQNNAIFHNPEDFLLLKTAPGIGQILGLVILYETHDIHRFKKHQNYASYSRVVRCEQISNGKVTGRKNQKIGNPYLKWAFNAMIIPARKSSEPISKYYQRLEARHGKPRTKARLAHKFCKAIYYILKNKTPFDEKRFLGKA
jgi:transposase